MKEYFLDKYLVRCCVCTETLVEESYSETSIKNNELLIGVSIHG